MDILRIMLEPNMILMNNAMIYGAIILAVITISLIAIILILFRGHRNVNNKTLHDARTEEIIEVLSEFRTWNKTISTTEGALSLLSEFNKFCVAVFGNNLQSQITKDEFYRMSLSQIKVFIDQMLDETEAMIISYRHL